MLACKCEKKPSVVGIGNNQAIGADEMEGAALLSRYHLGSRY
jgi:hypothetical protein